MSKFPYIKWSQNNNNITIQILNTSKPYTINNNNNFLEYKDNNYDINLELFNNFTISNTKTTTKDTIITINKETNDIKWKTLLKNETQYKFYISTDWDKFLEDELDDDDDTSNMDNQNMFNPDMFNSEQLQQMFANQQLHEDNEDNEENEIDNSLDEDSEIDNSLNEENKTD